MAHPSESKTRWHNAHLACRRRALHALIAAFLCATAHAEQIQFEYRSVHAAQTALRPHANAGYMHSTLQLKGPGLRAENNAPRLTIKALIDDIEIRVHPSGYFTLPVNEELLKENPQIWLNRDDQRGRVEIVEAVILRTPTAVRPDPKLLQNMYAEYERQRKQPGLLGGLFAPNLSTLTLDYGQPGNFSANVRMGDAFERFHSNEAGFIQLNWNADWMRQNAPIQSDAESVVTLEFE